MSWKAWDVPYVTEDAISYQLRRSNLRNLSTSLSRLTVLFSVVSGHDNFFSTGSGLVRLCLKDHY
jgi:hypothetical protein